QHDSDQRTITQQLQLLTQSISALQSKHDSDQTTTNKQLQSLASSLSDLQAKHDSDQTTMNTRFQVIFRNFSSAKAHNIASIATTFQNLYPPYSGDLALNDPLRDNSKGYQWTVSSNSFFTIGGTYYVTSKTKNTFEYGCAQNTNFSNFTYQVQMTIIEGDSGGIIFRADSANSKFY